MTKKILCLLFALILVCGVFMTGCSDDNTDKENATADVEENARLPMRLSLWLPTDEDTTDEAREQVSAAINKITQAKYNTAIDLHLIPRDEYQETIDEKLEEVELERLMKEMAEEAGETYQPASDNAETPDDNYPSIASDQLDIFMVSGYDNYMRYINDDLISMLNGELSAGSKMLKSYIYPHFFDVADEFGIYAIPNNHPVGEYQYLLVNKALVDKYDYNPDNFTSFARCVDFIIDMGNQNLEGLVPLLGPVEPSGVTFWGIDGEWSVIASQAGGDVAYNKQVEPYQLFSNTAYTTLYSRQRQLDELGYMGDGTLDEGEYFAVGVVKAKGDDIKKYEDDYYVTIHSAPECDEDDIFASMFAVSTFTKNLSRSMEIVALINTDMEMRTLLQYGVEGVHWEYEDDSETTIRIISDDYGMELLETGNVYMTYPGEGISMDYWEYCKQQNLDSITSPYIKFDGYVNDENRETLERIADYSKDVKARLDACPYSELTAFIRELRAEVASNPDVKAMLDPENENSIYSIYVEWYADKYPF